MCRSGHDGSVRCLAISTTQTRGRTLMQSGWQNELAQLPTSTAARRVGTLKNGFGVSASQEIVKDVRVFGRRAMETAARYGGDGAD
jgi:hypothetical protein